MLIFAKKEWDGLWQEYCKCNSFASDKCMLVHYIPILSNGGTLRCLNLRLHNISVIIIIQIL